MDSKILSICVKVIDLHFIWRHQQRNKIQWLAKDHSVIYRQLEASEVTSIPVKLSRMRSMTTRATTSLLTLLSKITRGLLSVMKRFRAIICLCNSNPLKSQCIKNKTSRKRTMKAHLIIFKHKIHSSWTTSNKRMLRP